MFCRVGGNAGRPAGELHPTWVGELWKATPERKGREKQSFDPVLYPVLIPT